MTTTVQTLAAQILAAWRRAERLEKEYAAGTLERTAAEIASARLRDLYQELTRIGVATDMTDDEIRERLATIVAEEGEVG